MTDNNPATPDIVQKAFDIQKGLEQASLDTMNLERIGGLLRGIAHDMHADCLRKAREAHDPAQPPKIFVDLREEVLLDAANALLMLTARIAHKEP